MVEHHHPEVSVVRQFRLLGISRSSPYYQSRKGLTKDLEMMRLIDEQHLKTPFYGSRKMCTFLRNLGYCINRKRVRRLMRQMGLEAIYPKPRTSQPGIGHKIYPYLLKELVIDRPNQIWATDLTYIPMERGFMYLIAIMDWYSRRVLTWRVSNTTGQFTQHQSLSQFLAKVPDPRCSGMCDHNLLDILIIAVCAVICGADEWQDMEDFGHCKEDWFRTFLELPAGIPSKYTFRRVFCLLDPLAFEACFTAWIKQTLTEISGSHHLAVDGKTMRGSKAQGKKPVLLVSAWSVELGLVLGKR
ncbi:hypothetical protein V5J35_000763 [Endozoicomonas sp. NE40]|uniref:Integrase n=3 Tax=Endozoicomonas lisbonensis TaxID=3120522 RepID=A0ABV2SCT1_9GAMM